MILQASQIKDIILNNPNRELIRKGVDYNKKLRMHLYGDGLQEEMSKVEGYETEDLHILRKKYARSNKDLFARLGRPIDKVFSARGGSIYFNLSNTQDKQARALSSNVKKGMSIRKWIETTWLAHLKDDPFGLIFMEVLPLQEAIKAKAEGRSVVYPTYKAISGIYDYLPSGPSVEYVVFTVSKQEKALAGIKEDKVVYRVVDDAMDYYVSHENGDVVIMKDHSYPNYFGSVPCVINSDLVSPKDDTFLSIYDEVIELAGEAMQKGSVKRVHDFLHGFPKYWQIATACGECNGTMYKDGQTCTTCKGSGKGVSTKVSDVMLFDMPGRDDQKVVPDVAGYVSPDKTYHEIATADLHTLENLMNVTLWGAGSKIQTQGISTGVDGGTATEAMLDIKPEADRLKTISEMAERRHKFILDSVIRINLELPAYVGSSVNYGRRYMIEGPDEIWEKYSSARTKGAPVSVLEDLLIEYYDAKYQGDELSYQIALKLMYVEPFVHYTPQQVEAMQTISPEDKAQKVYFTEWLSTLNEAMILSYSHELLKEQLKEYAAGKQVIQTQPTI